MPVSTIQVVPELSDTLIMDPQPAEFGTEDVMVHPVDGNL